MQDKTGPIVAILVSALVIGGIWFAVSGGDGAAQTQNAETENSAQVLMNDEPMMGESEMEEPMEDAAAPTMNIVETAQAAGTFNTLLEAATAAGLAEALSTQEVTVFAPTDEAFAALPEGTLEALLADPHQLAEVLKYHVVAGSVPAATAVTLDSAPTLQGSSFDITVEGDTVMVDGATVIQTDIMATNGIIHVIDSVILPS